MQSKKHLFNIESGVHYLNCAYMSPLLKSVEDAGIQGVKSKSTPWKISPDDFFAEALEVRRLFAKLTDCTEPERMAMVPSVSYAFANAARNIQVVPGQKIIVLGEQFPSNYYCWEELAREKELEVVVVHAPVTTYDRGKLWNQAILEAIDSSTALVAMPIVHWSDGTVFDVAAIRKATKEVGAYMVIDGTQSIGALPFSIQEIQPDMLVAASYKWLLGPYSMGIAYYGKRFDGGTPIEHSWMNRRDAENFSGLVDYTSEFKPGAARYEVGEHSNFALMPMLKKALEDLLTWGPEFVQDYTRQLLEPVESRILDLGFSMEDNAYRSSHLFGLRKKGLDIKELKRTLDKNNIWVSIRGSSIRVSLNVFNEEEDLRVFLNSIV